MNIKKIEKEIDSKERCPVCGRIVHCPGCCDYICPDCGADLDVNKKKSWPEVG
jgi:tRNA(Ile2) C34 agmatinyltransferase TiaS